MFFLDTSQVASADTSVDVSAFNQLAEAIGGDQIQTRRRRFNVFLGLKCPRRSSFSCSTSAPPSPPPPSPARRVLLLLLLLLLLLDKCSPQTCSSNQLDVVPILSKQRLYRNSIVIIFYLRQAQGLILKTASEMHVAP